MDLQVERITEQGWLSLVQLVFYFVMGFGVPRGLFDVALSLPNSRSGPTRPAPHRISPHGMKSVHSCSASTYG